MSIVETPIRALAPDRRIAEGGVHLVARHYAKGTMQVTTPKGRWLVPPDRAVWVPPLMEHAIDVLADIDMRTVYFDVGWLKRAARNRSLVREFVVRVSPLLQQAILALFETGDDHERTALLIKLAMLELRRADDSATFIPLPQEPRCRRAAELVLADPAGAHDIELVAEKIGTSARTLSRLFPAETELSFKSWCQRARIAAAIERLSTATNVSIKQVAGELGYASLPAFSHAFRQVTGRTPSDFALKA